MGFSPTQKTMLRQIKEEKPDFEKRWNVAQVQSPDRNAIRLYTYKAGKPIFVTVRYILPKEKYDITFSEVDPNTQKEINKVKVPSVKFEHLDEMIDLNLRRMRSEKKLSTMV